MNVRRIDRIRGSFWAYRKKRGERTVIAYRHGTTIERRILLLLVRAEKAAAGEVTDREYGYDGRSEKEEIADKTVQGTEVEAH